MMGSFRRISMRGLYSIGVGHLLKKKRRRKDQVPILLFHRVSPEPDPFWSPLPPEAFRNILTFFRSHYHFLPLQDLYQGKDLPGNAAFIAFDDAFQDFQDHALPILEELQLPATLFVPSGSIDSGEPIWPSLVDRYVEEHWSEEGAHLDLNGERIEWGTWRDHGKEGCAGFLKRELMSRSYEEQMEVQRLLEGKGHSYNVRPMNWKVLKELPSWIEIGGHTVDHPFLPSVEDERIIEREMKEGKERIEEMIGREVLSFAYPFGGYDERAVRIASELFEAAFTTDQEEVPIASFDPFRTPRIDVLDQDPKEAFLRVNGFHRLIKRNG